MQTGSSSLIILKWLTRVFYELKNIWKKKKPSRSKLLLTSNVMGQMWTCNKQGLSRFVVALPSTHQSVRLHCLPYMVSQYLKTSKYNISQFNFFVFQRHQYRHFITDSMVTRSHTPGAEYTPCSFTVRLQIFNMVCFTVGDVACQWSCSM